MEFSQLEIPPEVIVLILEQIDTVQNLLKMCQINQYLNTLIRSDKSSWQQLIEFDGLEEMKFVMDNYRFTNCHFMYDVYDDEIKTLDQDISYLAKCRHVHLRTFRLSENDLAILGASWSVRLDKCTGFHNDDIVHLKNCCKVNLFWCENLTGLCLQYLSKCHTVILNVPNISVDDIKHLSKCQSVRFHSDSQLTDDHLEHLANCPTVKLYYQNHISEKGFRYLANCDTVVIYHCNIDNIQSFLPLARCRQVIWNFTDITEKIRKLKESQKIDI